MNHFGLFLVLLIVPWSSATPAMNSNTEDEKLRSSEPVFPTGLISGLTSWFSDRMGTSAESVSDSSSASTDIKKDTMPALKIFDPIRNLVSKASSTATKTLSGLRNRVYGSLESVSNFLVDRISYAEQITKLPTQRLPEYARGIPIPFYNNLGISRRSEGHGGTGRMDRGSSTTNDEQTHEMVLSDSLKSKDKSEEEYNRYQSLEGTSHQQILDYEQFMKNDKSPPVENGFKDSLSKFATLYKKLRQILRQ